MGEGARARRGRGRSDDRPSGDRLFDRELDHLPPEVRWREWMNRVEATIFAASEPVTRSVLARVECTYFLGATSAGRYREISKPAATSHIVGFVQFFFIRLLLVRHSKFR
jgi:hypothetical protein